MRARLRAAAVVMLCFASQSAGAQDYPNREVHFICAISPGSGADIIVRYIAEKMRVLMKQSVIVENKPGATGNIATEYAARAKPDGYTIYVHAGSAIAANMHLFKRPPVDIQRLCRSWPRSTASPSCWSSMPSRRGPPLPA